MAIVMEILKRCGMKKPRLRKAEQTADVFGSEYEGVGSGLAFSVTNKPPQGVKRASTANELPLRPIPTRQFQTSYLGHE